MLVDHLANIHSINVISAENSNDFRIVSLDQVQVLVHRIRRALIPFVTHAHLRRHRGDKMFSEKVSAAPTPVKMFEQRLRLELGQNINREYA